MRHASGNDTDWNKYTAAEAGSWRELVLAASRLTQFASIDGI